MSEIDPSWDKWDTRDLEKLLSPIKFVQARDKQAHIDNHVQSAVAETSKARQVVPFVGNIPYGKSDAELLDVYGTDLGADGIPVFLWVHGGAWLTGNKDWSGFFIQNVYSWGFKSIIVGYPLCPELKLPEIVEVIQYAVIKAMGLFPKAKFVLAGHSAGAHLIANILCGDNRISKDQGILERIAGFALFSGIYDIRPVQRTILNDALDLSINEAETYSPLINTDKIQPGWLKKKCPVKVLLAVGKYDPPEFIRQCGKFGEALIALGFNETTFWVSEEDDHYTIIENMSKLESQSCRTLKEFLIKATESSFHETRINRRSKCFRINSCHYSKL